MPTDEEIAREIDELSCGCLYRKGVGADQLVLSTKPIQGESTQGFIGRIMALNCFYGCNPLKYVLDLKRSLNLKIWQERDAAAVEDALKLPTGTISEIQPTSKIDKVLHVRINHLDVQGKYVRGRYRIVSPASLRKSLHHRAVWALKTVPICPESREVLLRHCPRCGEYLNWYGFVGVNRCGMCMATCGESVDLRDTNCPIAEPLDECALDFLCGFFGANPSLHSLSRSMLDAGLRPLAGVDLHRLMLIMVSLHCSRDASEMKFIANVNDSPNTDWDYETFELGGRLLLGWPDTFYQLCANARTKSHLRTARTGIRRELGPIHDLTIRDDVPQSLRDLFRDVVSRERVMSFGGIVPLRPGHRWTPSEDFIQAKEAEKLIGKHFLSAERFVASMPRVGEEDGSLGRLSRPLIMSIAARLHSSVTPGELCFQLGIRKKFGDFACRLLGIKSLFDDAESPLPSARIEAATAEQLFADLRSRCAHQATPPSVEPLWLVMSKFPNQVVGSLLALRLILEGRLAAHLPEGSPNVDTVLVDPTVAFNTVRSEWMSQVARFDAGESIFIARGELCMVLVCSELAVEAFVRAPLLAKSQSRFRRTNSQPIVKFANHAVRRFRSIYVSGGEAFLEFGGSKFLTRANAYSHIVRVAEVMGGRFTLYDRAGFNAVKA